MLKSSWRSVSSAVVNGVLNRHDPFPVALADNAYLTDTKVDVGKPERSNLSGVSASLCK